MRDAETLMIDLRGRTTPEVADAVERLVLQGADVELSRVNPLAFASRHDLDEAECVAAFLHASRLGLFELSWNVVCGICGGVLESAASPQTLDKERYNCALCAAECEPVMDDRIEVTFTVDPRVRRIDAHDPETLPLWDYFRQIYLGSGNDLPADLTPVIDELTLGAVALPPGDRAVETVPLREGMVIVFDPVTHTATHLVIAGTPVAEPQSLTVVIDRARQPVRAVELRPGALHLTLENRASERVLPMLWLASEALVSLLGRRVPYLTGKKLLCHHAFRELFRTDVLGIDQRFKITSLTFLFTDLKGSTELYQRIGDLAAFDLVRAHFRALTEAAAAEGGAVVKTIGDAVMATFPTPAQGMAAALRMREAIEALNARHLQDGLSLKIGLHTGPSLAVVQNDRQDYFGQTVNIAARVQGLATTGSILATAASLDEATMARFESRGQSVSSTTRRLRGIDEDMVIYEIA